MYGSVDIAKKAIKLAITDDRNEEDTLIKEYAGEDIKSVAMDFGGNVVDSVHIIIERAIHASRKAGLTEECHVEDGAIAGAAREAITQIANRSVGLNGGGKIAVCRHKEHLSICIFMSIGLLHLNDVVIGLGHRSLSIG
jgi:hypothetical protein